MQIFHWLFKLSQEQPKIHTSTKDHINYKETKGKDIVSFKNSGSQRRSGRKFGSGNLGAFAFLRGKDVADACFNSTLNLRRLNRLNNKHHMKTKKEDYDNGINANTNNKIESTTQVVANNKVLPVNETTLSSSNTKGGPMDKSDKFKGDNKIKSRMKELLRWAAAEKSEKKGKFTGRKVLKFRSRGSIKAVGEAEEEREMSNEESPKISFGWDASSSVCSSSAISMASSSKTDLSINTPIHYRKGNWITTDSEFVVLEL